MANTPATPQQPVIGTIAGTNIPLDSQPINKWDWFKLSRTWVNGTEERFKNQVDNIQNTIKWFFTVGTGTTIFGVIVKDPKPGSLSLWIFGAGLFLLLIAYAVSSLAITLVSRSMPNPDSSASIRDTFSKSNLTSRWLIVTSSIAMVTGMGILPLAIVLAFQKPQDKPDLAPKLSAQYLTTTLKGTKQISALDISGYSPDSSTIKFRLSAGSTFTTSSMLDTFSHVLSHPRYDLHYSLARSIKLDDKHYYLTAIYKTAKDSLASQTVFLKP
ncbi:hypothetical protein PQ469_30760 [Mucilaginibacter sp. KACC 22773]|uniref:hypothetical protein n=1 Tax=Mucilaginibacter sp. KACC 22773 TaxID=3025671 RepID=UPI00236670DF|nr:hypothetical protein [Mucilaginibacter sp. KACC 22773]WDF78271.1 hypothetical protein PQ469_30760 [Mucilaginibacter sp. KACC 22773]